MERFKDKQRYTPKEFLDLTTLIYDQWCEQFQQNENTNYVSNDIQKLQNELNICKQTLNLHADKLKDLKQKNFLLLAENQKLKTQLEDFSEIKIVKSNTETLIKMFSQFYEQTKNNNKKQKIEKEAVISDVQPTIINRLDQIIHIGNICSGTVYSPIELKDKRIAIGGGDGSLSVFSLDYTNRKWVKDIFKEKVHSNEIQSICEINGNKLVSCSIDYTIKIWNISPKDLSCIKTLTSHTDSVFKVISLTQNRFASCSDDKSIKVWNSQEPYQEIANLLNEEGVYSIIGLNKKNEIVASCYKNIIVFWNLNHNSKTYTFKGYFVNYANHMIEIPNDKIAISPSSPSTSIIIIEFINYNVVKEIKLENFITGNSSLYLLNNESFIYIYNKCFVQISTKDFEILFKTQNMSQLGGKGGILTTEGGKYIITNSNDKGLEIIEPK